ncbi:MAG: hypothetical protein ACFN4U_04660, partial [Candidatus Absconditicoccaceae bacterium]
EELRADLTKKYSAEVAEQENQKLIEDLSPIMGSTYGIAIYQEQLMFLVQAMAGFSLGEADMLRRGVGKKKKEVIEKLKKEFITRGGSFRAYKPETTTYIYEKMIEPAASYSFNKSHSVCYAMIAYQTAYLKAHFPVEFSAALIRSVEEDTDTQSFYISEIQNKGISVLSPDVNASFNHVAAIGDAIRLGFFSVKGIGEDVGEVIQQERQKNGSFQSLEDFLKRCATIINKKSLDGLIKCGALDSFGDRNVLLENTQTLIDRSKTIPNADFGLFGGLGVDTSIQLKQVKPSNLMERLMMEQEVLKAFVSGNPLDGLYLYIKKFSFLNQVLAQENFPKFIIVGYIKEVQRAKKKGFFIKIEDISTSWEFFTKDALDFHKFDLIILHGSKKNGRIYLDKLVKTDYENLIRLAGGKYDPEWTVARAKKERYGDEKNKEIEKIKAEKSQVELEESNENSQKHEEEQLPGEEFIEEEAGLFTDEQVDEHGDEQVDEELEEKTFTLETLPENMEKIQSLMNILKHHEGDITVYILGKERKVSEVGLQNLKMLFPSS